MCWPLRAMYCIFSITFWRVCRAQIWLNSAMLPSVKKLVGSRRSPPIMGWVTLITDTPMAASSSRKENQAVIFRNIRDWS